MMRRVRSASMSRALRAGCAFVLVLCLQGGAQAQQAAVQPPARSGDAWVDGMLGDIGRYAARYPDAFADELVRYDSAPRALVAALLADPQWTPGDVYFACALGQVAGQPCRAVAQRWQQDHAQGWGAIAQGFGVTPDSAAFHRIKRGIVLSYQRWARPLRVDASLHAEFPKLALASPPSAADANAGSGAHAAQGSGSATSKAAKPRKASVKRRRDTP